MNIVGKNIVLRTAEISDAGFILELRQDAQLNKFISAVDNSVEKQAEWLKVYKEREKEGKEFYFIIEDKAGLRMGTIRVYGLTDDAFSWGSWVIRKGSPVTASIELALLVYDLGYYTLEKERCYFEVMEGNTAVVQFHKKFGAQVIDQKDGFFHFEVMKDKYPALRERYAKYTLPV